MTEIAEDGQLLQLTARIVAAHVGHNPVAPDALPELIHRVHAALTATQKPPVEAAVAKQQPAVPPRKSVFPDYLICLEDGKKLKMLKRHLQTSYGLTPAQYREKWGLPHDYPMVAPTYAETRSTLAKSIGLGRKPVVAPAAVPVVAPAAIPAPVPAGRKAGRPRKAAAA